MTKGCMMGLEEDNDEYIECVIESVPLVPSGAIAEVICSEPERREKTMNNLIIELKGVVKLRGKVIGKVVNIDAEDDFCKKCKIQLIYIGDGVYQCPKCGAIYEFDDVGDAVEKWRME